MEKKQRKKKTYEYLISFRFSDGLRNGYRESYIKTSSLTKKLIEGWRRDAIRECGYEKIVILNIIKLET